MDKIFLVGHRGVGKSTVMNDLRSKPKTYVCFDLDQEIEKRNNISIKELFKSGRAIEFRRMELDVLQNLISEFETINEYNDLTLVVALGAGFELEKFKRPEGSMLLWLRRATDSHGRIFSDRPGLTDNLDPFREWNEIFFDREKKYREFCTAQLFIPEFNNSRFNCLHEYLNFKVPKMGYVTLVPKENDQLLERIDVNVELRTDLISERQLFDFLKKKKSGKYIVAIRKHQLIDLDKLKLLSKNKNIEVKIDWDLAMGLPPISWLSDLSIFSSHGEDPVMDVLLAEDFINFFTSSIKSDDKRNFRSTQGMKRPISLSMDIEYKLCPEVSSHEEAVDLEVEFEQIMKGRKYSYLPRSAPSFNLCYHREIKSYQQDLGFYRFAEGTSEDQPLWWQWPKIKPKGFYGIFGQNISHSYTPAFHFEFFQKKKLWPLFVDSFDSFFFHVNYFRANKLKALAVTSPYKTLAFEFIKNVLSSANSCSENLNSRINPVMNQASLDSESQRFQSVNTLVFDTGIHGFNTDIIGLRSFLESNLDLQKPLIVWGGGALLQQLKELCPEGIFFSAQTGQGRTQHDDEAFFKILNTTTVSLPLIWASGEKGLSPDMINEKIVITKVVDLDYRESSRAKLYSHLKSIHYVSGLEFFVNQGLAQQKLWDKYEF